MSPKYPVVLMTPSYNRPNNIAEFVSSYGENLVKYDHKDVPILVVDDSVGKMAKTYQKNIQKAKPAGITAQYVGEKEKKEVLDYLEKKTKISMRDLDRIFKTPCYGGNRNWSVLYTFGEKYISVDDDNLPYGMFFKKKARTPLTGNAIWNGAFMNRKQMAEQGEKVEFDQIGAYMEFLGKKVKDFPKLKQGDVLFGVEEETAASLHASVRGDIKLNTANIVPKKLSPNMDIKFVIIHTSGDGDIDSEDIIINFIEEGTDELLRGREEYKYVFSNFETCLTKQSWRITPAILSVDNTNGVLPYAPTYHRFEDFVFRIYAAKHPNVVTAYANAMAHHERSLDARATIVNDFLNEEIARLMKRFLMNNVEGINDLQIKFPKKIDITLDDVKEFIAKGRKYYDQAIEKKQMNENYKRFAMEMESTLDYFRDPRRMLLFTQRTVQSEIDDINFTMDAWPKIYEAIMDYKKKKELPVQIYK